jgi:hypothetical protein
MHCKNDPQALTGQIGCRRAAGILTLDDILQFFTSQQNVLVGLVTREQQRERQHRM